jgi:hypothetical protein
LQLSFDVDNRAECPVGEEGEWRTLPSWVVDFSENMPEEDEEGEEEEAGRKEKRKEERGAVEAGLCTSCYEWQVWCYGGWTDLEG